MDRVKRICPVCSTPNPLEAQRCYECGSDIETSLPAIRGSKLPVSWREVGTSLALGATALAVRAGVNLLRGLLQQRTTRPSPLSKAPSQPRRPKRRPPSRDQEEQVPVPQPQVRVWGRRAWGMWRSDGASQWEQEEFFWASTGRGR